MLICLGGFLGSGRKILARGLAQKRGFHYYDLDQKKIHEFVPDASGSMMSVVRGGQSDEMRMLTYKHALAEFPSLAKMHPDMVMDDAFHRDAPRDYFFSEAKKYFKDVVFVWIESDDAGAEGRIRAMIERKMIKGPLERELRRREMSKIHFQAFTEQPLVFRFENSVDAAVEKLDTLIASRMR